MPIRESCTDIDPKRSYCEGMNSDLRNSLEAIANLLYLIRMSLHDPAAASIYIEMAEERMRAIGVLQNVSGSALPSLV
jgi:hypothetical protein